MNRLSLNRLKGTLTASLTQRSHCPKPLEWITQPFKLEAIVQRLFLEVRCFTNYILSSTIIGSVADAVAGRGTPALISMEPPPRLKPLSGLRRPPLHTQLQLRLHLRPLRSTKLRKLTVDLPISSDAQELLRIAKEYASKGNSKGVQTCLAYAFEFLHSDYKYIVGALTRYFHSTLISYSERSASPAPSLR